MAFRTSEYLQRYELVRYQLDDVIRIPPNSQAQQKTGYKFTINDTSSYYDWYNAYFEVQFQLQKLADGARYVVADRVAVIRLEIKLLMTDADVPKANTNSGYQARKCSKRCQCNHTS